MVGFDHSNGAGTPAHHQALGGDATIGIGDTSQEVAGGDSGGGEETVLGGDQIVQGDDGVHVVPQVNGLLPLFFVARMEPALHVSAHALERSGGNHTFGCTPDTKENVHTGIGPRAGDCAGHVAI